MKFRKILWKTIEVLLFLILITILICNCFFNNNEDKIKSFLAIIIDLGLIAFLVFLRLKFKKNDNDISTKKYLVIILIIFIATIVFQILLINNLFFKTGWDVSNLYFIGLYYPVFPSIETLMTLLYCKYLSVYPNNLFLGRIFILVGEIFGVERLYQNMVFANVGLINLSAVLLLRILTNLKFKRKEKIIGLILFELLIGLSPWILVPYSDILSLFIVTSLIFLYLKERKLFTDYILFGLFVTFGIMIKPTTLICVIAISICEIVKLISRMIENKKVKEIIITYVKKLLFSFLMMAIGCGVAVTVNKALEKKYPYEVDKNESMTIYHYLMMGANQETHGGFNITDYLESINHYGVKEKRDFNIKNWRERIKKVTPGFLVDKLTFTYNDGTFAWEQEGEFYFSNTFDYKDENLFNFFKSLFVGGEKNNKLFLNTTQIVWMMTLILMAYGVIASKDTNEKVFLSLIFIGQFIFLMTFETRARYLIQNVSIFVIIALMGFKKLSEISYKKKDIKKEEKEA